MTKFYIRVYIYAEGFFDKSWSVDAGLQSLWPTSSYIIATTRPANHDVWETSHILNNSCFVREYYISVQVTVYFMQVYTKMQLTLLQKKKKKKNHSRVIINFEWLLLGIDNENKGCLLFSAFTALSGVSNTTIITFSPHFAIRPLLKSLAPSS